MSKTPWKKMVSNPDYIGEADFDEGEEKIVTISHVKANVTVKTAEGSSQKAVCYFMEQGVKPMILNVAKSKSIQKVTGSKFVEDWTGTKIQLYIDDNVKAFGDIVSAVRVRPYKPKLKEQPKCEECGAVIVNAMGKTAEFLAMYTKKKYGRCLCSECAQKAAQDAQTAKEIDEAAEEQRAEQEAERDGES